MSQVIDSFEHVNTFRDDHEMCVNFLYKDKEFSLWWTSDKIAGAFLYKNDPTAVTILEGMAQVLDVMMTKTNTEYDDDGDDYRHTDWGFLDYGNH
jgi:hypothetical protein